MRPIQLITSGRILWPLMHMYRSSSSTVPTIRAQHMCHWVSAVALPSCVLLVYQREALFTKGTLPGNNRHMCWPLIEGNFLPINREFAESLSPKNLIGHSFSGNFYVEIANRGFFTHVLAYQEKLSKAHDLAKVDGEIIKKLNTELKDAVKTASEAEKEAKEAKDILRKSNRALIVQSNLARNLQELNTKLSEKLKAVEGERDLRNPMLPRLTNVKRHQSLPQERYLASCQTVPYGALSSDSRGRDNF